MAGVDLAEAYVLRNLYKEKRKEAEEGRKTKTETLSSKTKRSSGCFFWFSKKHRRTAKIDNSKKKFGGILDPIHI